MCSRGKCCVTFASFFTWLAFLASAVALFAPFWLTFESPDGLQRSKGLVLECTEPFDDNKNRSCDATLDETFKDGSWEEDLGDNFLIVQILWIAGTGIFLLAATFSIMLCCQRCMNKCCSFFNTTFVFLAVGCCIASGVMFYLDNDKRSWDRSDKEKGFFDWGFYAAIGGAGFGLLALCFTLMTICCLRKSVD